MLIICKAGAAARSEVNKKITLTTSQAHFYSPGMSVEIIGMQNQINARQMMIVESVERATLFTCRAANGWDMICREFRNLWCTVRYKFWEAWFELCDAIKEVWES